MDDQKFERSALKRELGIFERAQVLSGEYLPFNAVSVLRLAGSPEPEIIQRCLSALQDRHPLLRMRIAKEKAAYFFMEEGTPEIRLSIQRMDEEDGWKAVCEEELNTGFDIEKGPLVRCRYLRFHGKSGEAGIVMTFHHSIIDAASIACVFRELLSLSEAFQLTGTAQDFSSLPLLLPEESYFPSGFKGMTGKIRIMRFMFRQIGDEVRYRRQTRGKRKPPIPEKARCRILPLNLSPENTEKLVRQSRKNRVSLNSCLSAAIILAVIRNLYNERSLPVRYFIFADLRPYLEPPVPENNLGSYHSMMRLSVTVSGEQDFWGLARQVNEQVYTSSKAGEKFIQPLLSGKMMRMFIRLKKIRMGTTALSYPGVFNVAPNYGETKVKGVHGFVSNFPIGPEFTATARIFDRRLWLDCVYLDGEMDNEKAKAVAGEVMAILQGGR